MLSGQWVSGNVGSIGPTSVSGYVTLPPPGCPALATQAVQARALATVPTRSGVQRFTVPVTGTSQLYVNGEHTILSLAVHGQAVSCAHLPPFLKSQTFTSATAKPGDFGRRLYGLNTQSVKEPTRNHVGSPAFASSYRRCLEGVTGVSPLGYQGATLTASPAPYQEPSQGSYASSLTQHMILAYMCCMHVAGGEGGTLNGLQGRSLRGTYPSKTYSASGFPVADFQALAGIFYWHIWQQQN